MPSVTKSLLAFALSGVFVLASAAPASAHTAFESSSPADGDLVTEPIEQITLVFTTPADPTGDGFQVLDATGELRVPTSASSPDGRTWVLGFDPALAEGEIGVRWVVKAPDAHPIEGALSFSIEASASAPDVSQVASPRQRDNAVGGTTVADFLETNNDRDWLTFERVAPVARFVGLTGTVLGLGSMIFAMLVLRGSQQDIWHVLFWTRRGGLLVIVGAVGELLAQISAEGAGRLTLTGLFSVATSVFGIAIALRICGGLALASGIRFDLWDAGTAPDNLLDVRTSVPAREFAMASSRSSIAMSSVEFEAIPSRADVGYDRPGDLIWRPTSGSAVAYVGALTLLVSYGFDGHTVTEGKHLLTAAVNAVHVGGGAVWLGGVVMFAAVLRRRSRAGEDLAALPIALRFSVVASVALTLVGVAGLLLSFTILDTVSELWGTAWGRLLLVKVFIVALAAGAGAYNHYQLIPRLERVTNKASVSNELRLVVTIEAVLLVLALVTTAFLVGAAS